MIITKIIKMDANNPDTKEIALAAREIVKGNLVAFPTETVYGLGANALDKTAVEKIFIAKGRPADDPLIVHVSKEEEVKSLVTEIPDDAKLLMKKFWPGPLTIILKKSTLVPDNVTAGLSTVAVRMPSHKIANKIIKYAKVPVAAPSANSFSKPSPTNASHVIDDLKNKIDVIIDGGTCEVGLESTVIDLTTNPPLILRPGKITYEELKKVLPRVKIDPAIKEKADENIKPKSPGMKYTHYSPEAEIFLFEGKEKNVKEKINIYIKDLQSQGKTVGVLTTTKNHKYNVKKQIYIGHLVTDAAHNLFESFREFDRAKVDIILAEGVSEKGLGLAIMNRLRKASTCQVLVSIKE